MNLKPVVLRVAGAEVSLYLIDMTGSGRPGWCQLKLLSSMRAPRGVASMMVP